MRQPSRWIPLVEAARRMGICQRRAQTLAKDGRFIHQQLVGGRWMVGEPIKLTLINRGPKGRWVGEYGV